MQEQFLFYADFNCPFCFALNERILMLGDSAKILWRGIEHLPTASSRHSTLVDQTQLVNEVGTVRKRAPEVSLITPDFRPNTRIVNSLVLHLSRQLEDNPRLISELRTMIYRNYWHRGQDISDPDNLRRYCHMIGVEYPSVDFIAECAEQLAQWQCEWEGDQLHYRLPAMKSATMEKALLGFPTFDLLSNYFSGGDMPIVPDSLAACEMKPRQVILLAGDGIEDRCDVTELRAAYQVESMPTIRSAEAWMRQLVCRPDLIVIDHASLRESGLAWCSQLRMNPEHRNTAVIVLLEKSDKELELLGFDAGATDVMFDLDDPKICQARFDLQLRMKRSSVLLAALARLDYLTELPNRREFDRRFEEEWLRCRRKKTPLGLVVIDIDHFKTYNDNYGHSTGDDCLRQVALAMARCLHRPADLLARYGGEEFVAVLPDTDMDGTRAVAEALCEAVRDLALPHEHSSAADHVTVSAGLSSAVPEDDIVPRGLIEAADNSLYRSKAAGRDRVAHMEIGDVERINGSLASTGTFNNG